MGYQRDLEELMLMKYDLVLPLERQGDLLYVGRGAGAQALLQGTAAHVEVLLGVGVLVGSGAQAGPIDWTEVIVDPLEVIAIYLRLHLLL